MGRLSGWLAGATQQTAADSGDEEAAVDSTAQPTPPSVSLTPTRGRLDISITVPTKWTNGGGEKESSRHEDARAEARRGRATETSEQELCDARAERT